MPGKANAPTRNGVATSPPTSPSSSRERREFDPDDPDYIKDLQRPAVIKEDLNEMERRKRVRQILESKAFREELETLIVNERQQGNNAENLHTLEQLSELILPRSGQGLQQMTSSTTGAFGSSHVVVPIADIRGADGAKYTKQERMLRIKLAALYRLIDLFQWSQGIYNHSTVRVSSEFEHLLINPFGLLYHEITASSLVKIDFDGNILDSGTTSLGINEAGYVLHTTIHKARPDVRCIIHLHTPVVAAVTAMKCGLLPISQDAMIIGPVSYHDFRGIVNDENERESLVKDLGPVNKVMLLRNHGFVVCADTIEEAFQLTNSLINACDTQVMFLQGNGFLVCGSTIEEGFHLSLTLVQACEAQIRAARAGIENLVIPSEEAQRKVYESARERYAVQKSPDKQHGIKWKMGELEWEAWMRVLDNAGFRTGHMYRQPVLRTKAPTAQSDIEIPPAACSYGLLDETDPVALAQKVAQMHRDQERTRWLNSPNVYQKVEFEETGTSEPKKLTKWVQGETSPSHSTSMKIVSPHQFSPLSVNPKEFKDKQKAIKEYRRADNITAGPQSKILEGVTWTEGAQMNKDADMSGTQEKIMIGAASKGIIERDFRHNAQIYRQLYQPNPFASETDDDIQRYMSEVEQKTRSLSYRTDSGTLDRVDEVITGGSVSPDSVSLMQAARDHSPAHQNQTQLSGGRVTTFEANSERTTSTTSPAKVQPSSSGGWFQRSKSDRFPPRQHEKPGAVVVSHEKAAASDDDARVNGSDSKSPEKKDKKKKKFKTPSIFKGKKDKAAK